MKHLNVFILTAVITLSLLIGLGMFSNIGYFSFDQFVERDDLERLIFDSNDPKFTLVNSYNSIKNTNVDFRYSHNIEDMTKETLIQQIMLSWDLHKVPYTDSDANDLKNNIENMDIDLVKPVALIISAVNDATRLNEEALSSLSENEISFLNELNIKKDSLTIIEKEQLVSITRKVNTELQVQGAAYILEANTKAKPYLESYAERLPLQSTTSYNSPECSTFYGLPDNYVTGDKGVIFADNFCIIIIGNTVDNYYAAGKDPFNTRFRGIVIIDLGGNDFYSSEAGSASLGYPVGLSIDLSGSDKYYCDGYDQACQGGGFLGIGIMEDYAGNDDYYCNSALYDGYDDACQGGGIAGVGILNDYGGNDSYYCYRYCQGLGNLGGLGILNDYGSTNDVYSCHMDCQSSSPLGTIGIIIDESGDDQYFCKEWCMGSFNSILIDKEGNDNYSCDLHCGNFVYDLDGKKTFTCNIGPCWSTQRDIENFWRALMLCGFGTSYTNECIQNNVGDTSAPVPCNTVIQNNNQGSYYYKLGVQMNVTGTTINCIEGSALGLPFIVNNIPSSIVPYQDGRVGVAYCTWTVNSDNIDAIRGGRVDINNYKTNCRSEIIADLSVSTLQFLDNFNWCTSGTCNIAGSQSAESRVSYSYSGDWYATGANAISVSSVRSKSTVSTSIMKLNVNLPEVGAKPYLYSLSFDYKVHASFLSGLAVNLIRPDGSKIPCFVANGQSSGSTLRFDSTTQPVNPCTKMLPGSNTVEFVYSWRGSTTNPEAAFVDNLQINLRPA